jgi:hypothetical protein
MNISATFDVYSSFEKSSHFVFQTEMAIREAYKYRQ